MKMFHEFDGNIYIRTDAETYCGTRGDFEYEFGEKLAPLDVGLERVYEPGKRHAIMNRENVIAGGDREWDFGDRAIAAIAKLRKAQLARAEKQRREIDEAGRRELARVMAAIEAGQQPGPPRRLEEVLREMKSDAGDT